MTALGIAYSVLNEIDSVEPGSPADKAELSGKGSEPNKLTAGMNIARVELIAPPKKDKDADEPPAAKQEPAEFGPKGIGWPYFHAELQQLKPGTKVKFTLADDRTVELRAGRVGRVERPGPRIRLHRAANRAQGRFHWQSPADGRARNTR